MAETLTELKSLCELFQRVAAAHADQPALRTPGGAVEISWGESADRVRNIAGGLAELAPTSKLKRKPIAAKYASVSDALYAD